MHRRFRSLLVVGAIAALAALLLTGAGQATRGRAHVQAAVVFGGGEIGPGCSTTGFCPSMPRDFSLNAAGLGGAGVGEIVYGRNGSGTPTPFRVAVKCLAASGGRAVLGGVAANGLGFAIWVIDNGVPGSSTRDQASYAQVDTLDSPIWPAGFPRMCPSPVGDAFGGGYFDLVGDVTVHD